MLIDNHPVGAGLLVWTLSSCGGAEPGTFDKPLVSSGTGAATGAASQDGITSPQAPPAAPTNAAGPFKTAMYDIASAGCVFYPMDAEPPFAAVTISDGFGGSGGSGVSQTATVKRARSFRC